MLGQSKRVGLEKWQTLVLALLFAVFSNAKAQNSGNENTIILEAEYYRTVTLLDIISEHYKLSFSYEQHVIRPGQIIKTGKGSYTLAQLLAIIEKEISVNCEILENHVIVTKKKLQAAKREFTVSGVVKSSATGEQLIGVNIFLNNEKGIISNSYGFYSLTLPEGDYQLFFSYIGFKTRELAIHLEADQQLDVTLEENTATLQDITVYSSDVPDVIATPALGMNFLSSKTINEMPRLLGESDVIQALKLLPGVQMTNETSSGFSVHGGSRDQNLILLDESTVYNAAHLMGIFSVFNPDAIKNINLYKGYVPPQYGGRLASTVDIRMNEGNNKKYAASGGIGLIASRLTVEGPLAKQKGSFMISGRRTYADLLLRLQVNTNDDLEDASLYFYDFNAKANVSLNKSNRIYLSGYLGRDVFYLRDKEVKPDIRWGNGTFTLRWNHIFNPKLFSNTSAIVSDYKFHGFFNALIPGYKNAGGAWNARLRDYSIKSDFSFFSSPRLTSNFGGQMILHTFQPGEATLLYNDQVQSEVKIPDNRGLETAAYWESEFSPIAKLHINAGLRLSTFHNIGPATVYRVDQNYNIVDSVRYGKNEFYNHYYGAEPRISASYELTDNSSVKLSYDRSRQYVQIASNSTAGTPIDAWIPCSPTLKPQTADQVSTGYFRKLLQDEKQLELSAELYYKKYHNQIDFKDHSNPLLVDNIETQLRTGKAYSYGLELMLRKNMGKLTGWTSYTFSRAWRRINGINENKKYPATFDRPHSFSVVANWDVSPRISISGNFVYSSGSPFTSPSGRYVYENVVVPVYTERNGDRLPDYHRLDLSVTLREKYRKDKKWHHYWTFAVYNVYFKKNPTIINFSSDFPDENTTTANMYYVLPFLPSISYNFNF